MKTKIDYKSKLVRFTNIDNRNKAFNLLSKEDQRREIAWDCLGLILKKKIKAAKGKYWSNNLSQKVDKCKNPPQLQAMVLNVPKCEVCARGGMMLSQIRLSNTLSPHGSEIYKGNKSNIKGFSFKVFEDMEREYEYSYYYHPYGSRTTQKLANICCNIIKNGNFKPTDLTDYLK